MPTITMILSKEEIDQLISGALVECKVLPSMKPGSKFYLKAEKKYKRMRDDATLENHLIDILKGEEK